MRTGNWIIGLMQMAAVAVVSFSWVAAVRADGKPPEQKSFHDRCEEIAGQIERLKKTEDGQGFNEVPMEILRLEVVPRDQMPAEFKAQRALKARLWLKAFRVAAELVDPTWNAQRDADVASVATNLKFGTNYPRTIEQNNKKIRRSNVQISCRTYLKDWSPRMCGFLLWAFGKADEQELDALVQEELPAPALQTKLQEEFTRFEKYYLLGPGDQVVHRVPVTP